MLRHSPAVLRKSRLPLPDSLRSLHLLLLSALCAAAPACKSEAQRKAEAEVASVAHLVDMLRDAPNNAKQAPLDELRKHTCKAPQACELQQICVQAYALHGRAIDTTMRVRQAVRDGSDAVQTAQELLAMTERDLAQAKQMMDRCVSLEGELVRAAGL